MPDKPLPPLKYDENGRPLYMPKILRKWKLKRIRAQTESLMQAGAGRRRDENRIADDVLSGSEWLRLQTRRKRKLIDGQPSALERDVIDAVKAAMSVDDWKQAIANYKRTVHREAAPNESLDDQEKRIRSSVMCFDRIIKSIELSLKMEGGKFQQAEPPQPAVNLTQINFAGELEKNPDLVKLLLHQAKKQGLLEKVENQDETSQGTDAGA